jgi:hypothetical protein
MIRLLLTGLVLSGALAGAAQNRAPVRATQRKPTERVSPMPGVTLPTGASQRNAQPLPIPSQVQPNGTLPLPSIPSGNVTVGPLDSARVAKPARRPAPKVAPKRRP